jgi:cation transport regulator ChaB
MTDALTIRDEAMTAVEVRAQVNLIQEVMQAVMKNGVHYGTIPGTDKPTLLKPGAEKILATFRIAVTPYVDRETRTDDEYSVRIKAVGVAAGRELGAAFGEASSNEEKYKWRKVVCEEEFEETREDLRRVAHKKGRDGVYKVKQIRTHVADIANTVLKMGVKRAEVALCLQLTAASDIFTQDIEDLPPEIADGLADNKRPEIKMPTEKETAKAPESGGAKISEPQRKRLFAIAKAQNVTEEDLRLYLKRLAIEHTSDIPRAMYDSICGWAERGGQDEPGDAAE